MKVVLWAPVLYPWMIELARAFMQKGHEIAVLSNGIFGNYPEWKKFEKEVLLIPKINFMGEDLPHSSIFSAFTRSKPDLFIVLATETVASMAIITFARICNIRTILIVENNLERKYDNITKKFAGQLKKLLVSYIHKKANVLIAESEASYEYLLRMGCSGKKIYMIPHGTNIHQFRPEKADVQFIRKYQFNEEVLGKQKVLYLGGFNYHKGIDSLVTSILDNSLKHIVFLIPSFGPLGDKYIQMLKSRNNVILIPQMGFDEMIQLYAIADIVIVPSLSNDKEGSERSPNVVIEALSCGKVVIGTNVGGIPTYIGDSGIIIAQNDSDAIIRTLIELASDEKLMTDMKKRGRIHAEKMFDIGNYANNLIEISGMISRQNEGGK